MRKFGVGAAVVAVLVVAAVAVAIGAVRGLSDQPQTVALSPTAAGVEPAVYVHIHGEVVAPGIYRLGSDARVVDAIAAAGGLTTDADDSAVNLARLVVDGEQLRVPAVGEEPAPQAGAAVADGRVALNSADGPALETLPGIGPALAERIISWRSEHGPFRAVEDLLGVPGIGDKVLAGLRDQVTL